jgi:GH43 family beta-xylosidase
VTFLLERGEDPWGIYWQGDFYYCHEYNDSTILVNRSRTLHGIRDNPVIVWMNGGPARELWAPELHRIDGCWYIYYAEGPGDDHRMHVLQGQGPDPQSAYLYRGRMNTGDSFAIDGTPFEWRGRWYFVWSGSDKGHNTQKLFIDCMENPWLLAGNPVCISAPTFDWERRGMPTWPDINEAPQALRHPTAERMFIVYSASHSVTDDYCLGRLDLPGPDPMSPGAWRKPPYPVFSKYVDDHIYGPGHASFVDTPDGGSWIIYHCSPVSGGGWDSRQLRAQPFYWHTEGTPDFGHPGQIRTQTVHGLAPPAPVPGKLQILPGEGSGTEPAQVH